LATVDPQDTWQQHFADTVIEGYFLGDPRVAELMAREAPVAAEELAAWGCPFARTPDGHIDQLYFGAHRRRRTAYVGDVTARARARHPHSRREAEARQRAAPTATGAAWPAGAPGERGS